MEGQCINLHFFCELVRGSDKKHPILLQQHLQTTLAGFFWSRRSSVPSFQPLSAAKWMALHMSASSWFTTVEDMNSRHSEK